MLIVRKKMAKPIRTILAIKPIIIGRGIPKGRQIMYVRPDAEEPAYKIRMMNSMIIIIPNTNRITIIIILL